MNKKQEQETIEGAYGRFLAGELYPEIKCSFVTASGSNIEGKCKLLNGVLVPVVLSGDNSNREKSLPIMKLIHECSKK
jgi:hypothetical protein